MSSTGEHRCHVEIMKQLPPFVGRQQRFWCDMLPQHLVELLGFTVVVTTTFDFKWSRVTTVSTRYLFISFVIRHSHFTWSRSVIISLYPPSPVH